MKRTVFLTLVIVLGNIFTFATPTEQEKNKLYVFPEKKEWKNLDTPQKRKKALQIPANVLSQISTEELLDVCFDYPYLLDFLFYDSYQQGLEALARQFNGFKELLGRKDIAAPLTKKCKTLANSIQATEKGTKESGMLSYKWKVFHLLAAQKDVKKQLNASQWQEIASVRERLSTRDGERPWINFNLDGIVTYTPVDVYTPKGSLVGSTYRITGAEYLLPTEEQTAALSDFIYKNYNCAELLSGEDFRYNCHAYAWHMTDGHMNDTIWMGRAEQTEGELNQHQNINAFTKYFGDDSYLEVPDSIAEKVVYGRGINSHSAVRLNSDEYVSKWGDGPLVRHSPNEVPSGQDGIDKDSTIYDVVHKKYYKLATSLMVGETSSTESTKCYAVSNLNLFPGYSVVWSFSNNSGNILLEQDTPSANQCRITNLSNYNISGKLKAHLYYNNKVQCELARSITLAGQPAQPVQPFSGTYSQEGGIVNGVYVPDIEETEFGDYGHLFVRCGCNITLNSPNFIGNTVTHSGGTEVQNWYDNGQGTITFSVSPDIRYDKTYTVQVKTFSGVLAAKFYIHVSRVGNGILGGPRLQVSQSGHTCHVLLTSDSETMPTIVGESGWELKIYRYSNGKCVYQEAVSEATKTKPINTAGWQEDYYIFEATIGEQKISKKILIK